MPRAFHSSQPGRNSFPALAEKFTPHCPGRQVRHDSYPIHVFTPSAG
ncbi:hypothetical protein HMPREF3038_03131 [Akkermansia sp. KLE1797]|nr:hypothetical protein HMPREF3038_03131 [Akkermansia sp. KLE1797]